MLRSRRVFFIALLIFSGWLLAASPLDGQSNTLTNFIRFASVGDYGADNANAQAVANLIAGWNPDIVITTGDNNYLNNSSIASWDIAVGQYYGSFIHYPITSTSIYSPGLSINRFFPALGNHDWDAGGYTDYFDLPSNERYYDFAQGPVHFFVLDSDSREPDGNTADSTQGQWLHAQLAASSAPWKIIIFHHPPYSSAQHGDSTWMQWPFRAWGASLVLNGHEHDYERIMKNGFPYIVNGFGGRGLYNFVNIDPDSVARYNSDYGALLIEATPIMLTVRAYSIANGGTLIDSLTLDHRTDPLVIAGATWRYLDDGSDQGTAWREPAFDDSAWPSGPAPLGYGDPMSTTIGFGLDPNHKYITTYFRHTFTVTQPALYSGLALSVQRDDGAAIYLNGSEVWRTNLPPGVIISTTLATAVVSGTAESAWHTTLLSSTYLVTGTNVLAVEVHQINGASSDLGFNLTLRGNLSYAVYLPLILK